MLVRKAEIRCWIPGNGAFYFSRFFPDNFCLFYADILDFATEILVLKVTNSFIITRKPLLLPVIKPDSHYVVLVGLAKDPKDKGLKLSLCLLGLFARP